MGTDGIDPIRLLKRKPEPTPQLVNDGLVVHERIRDLVRLLPRLPRLVEELIRSERVAELARVEILDRDVEDLAGHEVLDRLRVVAREAVLRQVGHLAQPHGRLGDAHDLAGVEAAVLCERLDLGRPRLEHERARRRAHELAVAVEARGGSLQRGVLA